MDDNETRARRMIEIAKLGKIAREHAEEKAKILRAAGVFQEHQLTYLADLQAKMKLLSADISPWTQMGSFEVNEQTRRFALLVQNDALFTRMKIAAATHFTLPAAEEAEALAAKFRAMAEPYARVAAFSAQTNELSRRMALMTRPWAHIDAMERSVMGFAQLTRFGAVLHSAPPFASDTRVIVETELGSVIDDVSDEPEEQREERYDAAGRNPALVAFPAVAYPEVIEAAGLSLSVALPLLPRPIENTEAVAADTDASSMIRSLEIHLRNFIADQLGKLGPEWALHKVSPAVRQLWEQRQQKDRDRNRPIFDLIHYADFSHLEEIIIDRTNWRTTFRPFFGDKAEVSVSFRRLVPIRNANAHSRPLTQSDMLTLAAETVCLLRAIGIRG